MNTFDQGGGGEVGYEVSDDEVELALSGLSEQDLPGLGAVLAKYVPAAQSPEEVSPRRRQVFMARAASLGLINAAEGLSLREYMAAPLLLPVYIEAAATSVRGALSRFAMSASQALNPAQTLNRLTVYATLIQSPSFGVAHAGVLRGTGLTPLRAYQAGSISIFVTTARDRQPASASCSLEALVAREG